MTQIKSIKITNSPFFNDNFELKFSPKLNCLMGGRGTGKSTLLCFIDACTKIAAEQDTDTFNILRSNLGDGVIVLEIETNDGGVYEIHKTLGDEAQPYIKSNGQFVPIESIAAEIELDIYPAQKIENIGKSYRERLILIDRMLKSEVRNLEKNIELQRLRLKKNGNDIRGVNIELRDNAERLMDYASVKQDLEALKSEQPPDLNKGEELAFNREIAAEKVRESERRYLKKLGDFIKQTIVRIESQINELETDYLVTSPTVAFLNTEILKPVVDEAGTIVQNAIRTNKETVSQLQEFEAKLSTAGQRLSEVHAVQHNKFVELRQKQEKHKSYYDRLNVLAKRDESRNVVLKDIENLKSRKELLNSQRAVGVAELNSYKNEIHSKRLAIVQKLNDQFDGSRIKVQLTQGGIVDEYADALRQGLKGHGLRYNALVPNIVRSFTPDKFAEIVHDRDVEKLKDITGIDKERSQAIVEALHETDEIYDIETIYCPDLPDFYLKVDRQGDSSDSSVELFRKSDELSTGQRCTTVLPIVFAISDNPLIIDQPEDNLENRFISDTIRKIIKEHKDKRQLVFITHNPNIPVLSESESNVFLKFEEKEASVLATGSVDDVKEQILELLEGGESAFIEREKLYGLGAQ